MGFQRMVPKSRGVELAEHMKAVYEGRGHVKTVKVNPANNFLEIDLDGMANFAGHPDMYMPIKRGKTNDAKALVERMMSQVQQGIAPSSADSDALFDMIDQQGG